MTDTKTFPLSYEIIEQLFQNGVCLTYNPTEQTAAWQYGMQLQETFMKQNNVKRCRLVSQTAKLWQRSYHPVFHYFSDGSLIFSRWLQDGDASKVLERVKKLLQIRGYKINRIYAPQEQIDYYNYDKMLRHISEQSLIRYPYTDDLTAVPFPDKDEFVKECFTDGNILLTACKYENIRPECRQYLAVFADGRFYISDNYGSRVETANFSKITRFERENSEYLRLQLEHVPQEYIEALYIKAAEYDWYETPVAAEQKYKLNSDELNTMHKYIDNLFNNHKCVSVLNPENINEMLTPDLDKYALFSDGLLLIGQSRTRFGEDSFFIGQMHKAYPDYNFKIEQVPDFYLPEIYNKLPEYQKGAAIIYIEMLKQKARKLKRLLEIPHHEALDIVAQMAGWKNWKNIEIENEAHARHLVHHEIWRKQSILRQAEENPLMWEYQRWQMRQKHPK